MSCSRRERDGKERAKAIAKSFRLSIIDWFHVSQLYMPYVLGCALAVALASLVPASWQRGNLDDVAAAAAAASVASAHVYSHWWAYGVLAACAYWALGVKPSVYLLDFATFEPPASWQVSQDDIIELIRLQGVYTEESVDFQRRLLERSGTGQATHWPPTILRSIRPQFVGAVNGTTHSTLVTGGGAATGNSGGEGSAASTAAAAAGEGSDSDSGGSAEDTAADAASATAAAGAGGRGGEVHPIAPTTGKGASSGAAAVPAPSPPSPFVKMDRSIEGEGVGVGGSYGDDALGRGAGVCMG